MTTGGGRRSSRIAAAVAAFGVAALIAAYWVATIGLAVGPDLTGADVVEFLPLAAGAAAMVLLPVLAGLHALDVPAERFARWRVPAAVALAVVALPLVVTYGFGVYAATGAVVLARRARRRGDGSPAASLALVVGWVGIVAGGVMLLLAVGLCGPRILGGFCDA